MLPRFSPCVSRPDPAWAAILLQTKKIDTRKVAEGLPQQFSNRPNRFPIWFEMLFTECRLLYFQ
jgi:hypothetical protein